MEGNWGPIVTVIICLVGIISTAAFYIMTGLKKDVEKIGNRIGELYTYTDEHFVKQEVCELKERGMNMAAETGKAVATELAKAVTALAQAVSGNGKSG